MSEPYCMWCAAGICSGNLGSATKAELLAADPVRRTARPAAITPAGDITWRSVLQRMLPTRRPNDG